jgi:hypothetical protein
VNVLNLNALDQRLSRRHAFNLQHLSCLFEFSFSLRIHWHEVFDVLGLVSETKFLEAALFVVKRDRKCAQNIPVIDVSNGLWVLVLLGLDVVLDALSGISVEHVQFTFPEN